MTFLPNLTSRVMRPFSLSNILPGRDGRKRRVQRVSATSVLPEMLSSPRTKSDVIYEHPSPTVPESASSVFLSISNTLRSKARVFYVNSIRAEMEKPGNIAADTSGIRPSSRSHDNAGSLGGSHKEHQGLLERTASLDDSRKEHHKFLEFTGSSPLSYKKTPLGSNADRVKSSTVGFEYDDEFSTYLEPFNFESFGPRDLDFNSDDDYNAGPCDDGVSGDESSDHERFRFISNRHASDYRPLDFNFCRGDENGPWNLRPFEGSNSTYNLSEPSATSSSSMSSEENTLATSNNAYQACLPESNGFSSLISGSLSTETQHPLVEAQSRSRSPYLITKPMDDTDTSSEHESDFLTELVRFPNCFKHRATDNGEAGWKTESSMFETHAIGDGYNPERAFNAAKLPQFDAYLSGNHLTQPSI